MATSRLQSLEFGQKMLAVAPVLAVIGAISAVPVTRFFVLPALLVLMSALGGALCSLPAVYCWRRSLYWPGAIALASVVVLLGVVIQTPSEPEVRVLGVLLWACCGFFAGLALFRRPIKRYLGAGTPN